MSMDCKFFRHFTFTRLEERLVLLSVHIKYQQYSQQHIYMENLGALVSCKTFNKAYITMRLNLQKQFYFIVLNFSLRAEAPVTH